jgi:hypothetical protein
MTDIEQVILWLERVETGLKNIANLDAQWHYSIANVALIECDNALAILKKLNDNE